MTPNQVDAETASIGIFEALWSEASRYDPQSASEPAFVTMVARRHLLARQRGAAERPKLKPTPESAIGDQSDALERCVEASLAASTLAALDPRQRRALSLAIGHGMTATEIADLDHMAPDVVKSLVRRALVAVRKRMAEFRTSLEDAAASRDVP